MNPQLKFENIDCTCEKVLSDIEIFVGIELSEELKKLLSNYSGGEPTIQGKPCMIDLTHPDGWTQEYFITKIKSCKSIVDQLNNLDYLIEYRDHFNISNEYVEIEKLLPLIEVLNGEILISIEGQHKGKLYLADNGDFGIMLIADSLDGFFQKVYS